MTPADVTLAPLHRGRRARAPFVRRPPQASQVRVGRATRPRWPPGGGRRRGRASSMPPPRRFLGIWMEADRHLLTTRGGPPVLGSVSERRSASATPTYAANTVPRRAFNSAQGDTPRASAHSRALGPSARRTSPKQPGPGAERRVLSIPIGPFFLSSITRRSTGLVLAPGGCCVGGGGRERPGSRAPTDTWTRIPRPPVSRVV